MVSKKEKIHHAPRDGKYFCTAHCMYILRPKKLEKNVRKMKSKLK